MRLDDKFQDENIVLHFMTAVELNTYISHGQLINRIKSIEEEYPDKMLSLAIFGLKEYCRDNRQNAGRFAFETALTELQLLRGISHRLLDTADDVAHMFVQFSKSIAEKLYKWDTICDMLSKFLSDSNASLFLFRKDRDDKMSDQNFYLANDNKDCVQVKDNVGLTNLWKNHLCKFPTVTLDTAEAILTQYPTASQLIDVSFFLSIM